MHERDLSDFCLYASDVIIVLRVGDESAASCGNCEHMTVSCLLFTLTMVVSNLRLNCTEFSGRALETVLFCQNSAYKRKKKDKIISRLILFDATAASSFGMECCKIAILTCFVLVVELHNAQWT